MLIDLMMLIYYNNTLFNSKCNIYHTLSFILLLGYKYSGKNCTLLNFKSYFSYALSGYVFFLLQGFLSDPIVCDEGNPPCLSCLQKQPRKIYTKRSLPGKECKHLSLNPINFEYFNNYGILCYSYGY